jgi:hypothetical protein
VRATRVVISIFASSPARPLLSEHRVGEISQESMGPAGLLIQSWPNTDAFAILAGEQALTGGKRHSAE